MTRGWPVDRRRPPQSSPLRRGSTPSKASRRASRLRRSRTRTSSACGSTWRRETASLVRTKCRGGDESAAPNRRFGTTSRRACARPRPRTRCASAPSRRARASRPRTSSAWRAAWPSPELPGRLRLPPGPGGGDLRRLWRRMLARSTFDRPSALCDISDLYSRFGSFRSGSRIRAPFITFVLKRGARARPSPGKNRGLQSHIFTLCAFSDLAHIWSRARVIYFVCRRRVPNCHSPFSRPGWGARGGGECAGCLWARERCVMCVPALRFVFHNIEGYPQVSSNIEG